MLSFMNISKKRYLFKNNVYRCSYFNEPWIVPRTEDVKIDKCDRSEAVGILFTKTIIIICVTN